MEFKPFFKLDEKDLFDDSKPQRKNRAHPFLSAQSTVVPKNFSDPFENLFSTPQPKSNIFQTKLNIKDTPEKIDTFKNKSNSPKQLSILSALGVFMAVVCLLSLVLTVLDQSSLISEKRFAYIEFKIMSPSGNVSPGAEVIINGEKMGVSDSFGEWRRFVRVGLGNELKVEIAKENTFPPLKAQKIMSIPSELNSHEELEIKSTIKLAKTNKPTNQG